MKNLTKILLLILTLALSVGALVACGDDGEVSYREVTEEEWKAAFVFSNATMVSTEKVYTDGKLTNQYTSNVFFVDGIAYDLADLEKIVRDSDLNVTITVSCAPEDATETMKKYL